jgi:hypothetical protein
VNGRVTPHHRALLKLHLGAIAALECARHAIVITRSTAS